MGMEFIGLQIKRMKTPTHFKSRIQKLTKVQEINDQYHHPKILKIWLEIAQIVNIQDQQDKAKAMYYRLIMLIKTNIRQVNQIN